MYDHLSTRKETKDSVESLATNRDLKKQKDINHPYLLYSDNMLAKHKISGGLHIDDEIMSINCLYVYLVIIMRTCSVLIVICRQGNGRISREYWFSVQGESHTGKY